MNVSFSVSRFSMRALFLLFLIHGVLARDKLPLDNNNERLALLELRRSLGIRARDWPRKADHCASWRGVHCVNGRVTEINVSRFRRTRFASLKPKFAVDALGNLTQLSSFNASGFLLPGSIPEWFGQRLDLLKVLDLSSCSVSGAIPSSIGNLTKLELLSIGDNELAGSIPSTLERLPKLSELNLSRNSLTGSIPEELVHLRNLTRLDLSSNFFSGSIPDGLGTLSSLQFLNFSDNSLTGMVPVELGNLSKLVALDLSKNSFTGSLPVELKELSRLRLLYIGYNGLDGPIPKGLFTSLSHLEVVELSGNMLDGSLSSALWSMPKLRFFDVSGNNFTGELPSSGLDAEATGAFFNLSNNQLYGALNSSFRSFSSIDLSSNYFQGKVLDEVGSNVILDQDCLQDRENQRSLEECSQFYAQRGLKFDGFGDQTETQSSFSDSDKKSNRQLKFVLIGVFGGIGFIVLLVTMAILLLKTCNKRTVSQRGSANVGPIPEGDGQSYPKDLIDVTGPGELHTYDQILRFTNNFSEANLIKHGHSGDLFRGFLEGGAPVVIKRIFKIESYLSELDFFAKISHAKLVPLMGYCFEHDYEKHLVYKYMPNGDLASSLHRFSSPEDGGVKSLDWITRLKIATGAAEVLSYLHHECVPPIVHRDVQASSILLDDRYEVRLGSLSESCSLEGDSHLNGLARLWRKPQTSEQGSSGLSSANFAYDVYCFGIVLLELITGKVGISKSDENCIREWLEQNLPYISLHDKELVTKIVDPSLIIDDDLLEEVWAMAIVARSCLNPRPTKRPLMRYILKALENPLKVVRIEHSSSARLRTASSRRSWSAAFFGSWRQTSSDRATAASQINKEGVSGLKQSGRSGSHGSGGNDHSSSNKRLSSEIFPEPMDIEDVEPR